MSKYSKLCDLRRAVEDFCYDFIPRDKNFSYLTREERKAYSKAISLLDRLDDAIVPYEKVFQDRYTFVHNCYKMLQMGMELSPEEIDLFFECAPRDILPEMEYDFVVDKLKEIF